MYKKETDSSLEEFIRAYTQLSKYKKFKINSSITWYFLKEGQILRFLDCFRVIVWPFLAPFVWGSLALALLVGAMFVHHLAPGVAAIALAGAAWLSWKDVCSHEVE